MTYQKVEKIYKVEKTKLTDNDINDSNPYLASDGDISWQRAVGEDDINVWYYDYSEKDGYSEDKSVSIGKSPQLETNPYIYSKEEETSVVYETKSDDGNSDIFYWNSEVANKKITDTPGKETKPEVWGDYVVYNYQEKSKGDYYKDTSPERDIYLYDIENDETTKIATGEGDEYNHHIVGEYVVYEKESGENSDIYLYDIAEEKTTEIATGDKNETNAQVWGNGNVVYEYEVGKDNKDIRYYDNLTGKTIVLADSKGNEINPDISGNYITWQGWDGNDYEIYRYDIADESVKKLTDNKVDDYAPKVSTEGYVVYQQDWSEDNTDVYLYTDAKTIALGNSDYNEAKPEIYGDKVTWQAWDGNDWEVYSAEITLDF
ncbi:MAG: hypothetical protein Tsb0014_45230 [Pleurocapsa sp.]